MRRTLLTLVTALALASACDTAPGTPDAASPRDAAADARIDATLDAASDGGVAPGTRVTLTYRGGTVELHRAFFGYARSGDTVTGLYFELSRGGDDACPTEESPIPDQIVTVSGFDRAEPATRTSADGVRAHFFDFEGALREEIAPAEATVVAVELTALDVSAGTARANVQLTFDEGAAHGPLVATHCASLDGE